MTFPPSNQPSSPPHAAPVEHISGPAELVQAVPYLLGFHPSASLVLIGLADKQLVVTARVDLVDDADRSFEAVTAHTIGAMRRGGSRQLLGVVYPVDGADEHRIVAIVHEAAADVGCEVLEVLQVADGHWRSLLCTAVNCCPPPGRPLPSGTSPFAAAATVSGVVALPDRDSVGRQLDPRPGRDDLLPLLEQAEHAQHEAVLSGRGRRRTRSIKRAILAAARLTDDPPPTGSGEGDPAGLDDAAVARFGVMLGETVIRDAIWTAIDDRRVDGRALWRELALRLPPPYDAPALFLFGWATWRAGDGALAGMAAERAVASDPTYSAADLLLAALTHGIDPRALPRMRLPHSA